MNASLNQGSATIYQFPAGGRAALGGRRYGEASLAPDLVSAHATVAASNSWYHEAAIQESKPAGEH